MTPPPSPGYYLICNSVTGEYISLCPPISLLSLPDGSVAYPITRAQHSGITDGTLAWDPVTRTVVDSVETVKAKNAEVLKGRFRAAHDANQAFLAITAPAPPVLNQQIKELTKQVNDLLRYLSGQTETLD